MVLQASDPEGDELAVEILMPMGNSLPATLFNNLLNATAGTISGATTAVGAIQGASTGKPIVLAVTPNITDTASFSTS